MRKVLFLVLLVFLAVGCDEGDPMGTPGATFIVRTQQSQSRVLSQLADVLGAEVEIPSEKPARYSDLEILIAELREAGGSALVGFKEVDRPRLLSQEGPLVTRHRIRASTIRAGIQVLEEEGAHVLRYFPSIGAVAVTIEPEVVRAIFLDPLVDYIEPDKVFHLSRAARSVTSSPPPFSQSTPWGMTAIGATRSWLDEDGGGKILVIDTGHDQGHEDLPSVQSANCGGTYDGCDDGINFHGTHVLGVVTARNNSIGVVGVAPGVSSTSTFVWGACNASTGLCSTVQVTAGIQAGVSWDVDVINMSFGFEGYDAGIASAIGSANQAGIVMVASAGNHCHNAGCPTNGARYPASDSRVIGVSGVNQDSTFAHPSTRGACDGWSSNYGIHVDLAAPFDALSTDGNDDYSVECGTSFSAPHVAGVIALIRGMAPNLTSLQIWQRLLGTATDLGPSGYDQQFGEGLVNAWAATGPHVEIHGPREIVPDQTCEWSAASPGGFGSISYKWYVDGNLRGSSSTFSTDAEDDFVLRLVISDGQWITREEFFTVDVDSENDECDW